MSDRYEIFKHVKEESWVSGSPLLMKAYAFVKDNVTDMVYALCKFENISDDVIAVSYTHLDVYKRQEFHNSKNAVWNAIQEALQAAGFIIADVRTLDKKQGSFKQVTSANATKQDMIISCYKPSSELEERFRLTAGTEEGVWDFVRNHLKKLPVFALKDGNMEILAERQNYRCV